MKASLKPLFGVLKNRLCQIGTLITKLAAASLKKVVAAKTWLLPIAVTVVLGMMVCLSRGANELKPVTARA